MRSLIKSLAIRSLAAPIAALLLLGAPARADTIVVSKGGAIPTIQGGVAAAAAGDTVVVKAGIYRENVVIDGLDGLTLRASGKVIIDARPAGGAGKGPGIRVLDSEGVAIDGFVVRNAKADPNGTPKGYGIECNGADHAVEDCTVLSSGDVGIYVSGAGVRIDGCSVANCRGGLSIVGDDADVTQCEVRASIGDGIVIIGLRARLSKVKVTDVEDDNGLDVTGDFAEVAKCKFANIESQGVDITGNSARVERCEFEATGYGLYVEGDDCVIDDNEFRDCPGEALFTRGDNPTITDNDIDRVADDYYGIYVDDAATGGTIEDNQVAHTAQEGVGVSGTCNNLVIRKNTVRLCGYSDETGFEIRGNGHLIEDNKAIKSGADGFNIRGNNHVLRGNLAADGGQDGFDIDSATANNVTLEDNVAKGNAAEGIENNGTNAILTGNKAEKNRIDVANDGTIATFSGNVFSTGGQNTDPEID